MSIQAVVFDFDGLIIDTEVPSFKAWRDLYREHGADLVETDWHAAVGTAGAVDAYALLVERATVPVATEKEIRAAKMARQQEMVLAEAVLPGVIEWINEAHRLGLALAVASSSSPEWVEGHLERLDLARWFGAIVGRPEGFAPKPSPDLYLTALQAVGVAPAAAIAVEDSPNGIAAAKAAGMFCVAVPGPMTRPLDFSRADLVLDSLADLPLPDLVDRLR